jgi:HAD superfamily hydrolase (TIGR01509 family)
MDKVPRLEDLRKRFPSLKALIFDMDGTLFDTESFHTRAFLRIGEEFQIRPPLPLKEIHSLLVGKADHLVYEVVKSWVGFPSEWTADEFVRIKSNHLLESLKSVSPDHYFPQELAALLNDARSDGINLALVTSSEKIITQELLKLAKISEVFDLILTRDDCPHHKPHPWPYLSALKSLGLESLEAVIFEDSAVGLEAACAAGANVIKVDWHPNFDINKV